MPRSARAVRHWSFLAGDLLEKFVRFLSLLAPSHSTYLVKGFRNGSANQ